MEVLKYSFKMAATDSSRCPMYPVMLQSSWIIYVIISNTWMFPASAILNGKSAGLIGAICAPAGPAWIFCYECVFFYLSSEPECSLICCVCVIVFLLFN